MTDAPWNVSESEEGRDTLERLAAEYQAAGQLRELGITLTRLARVIKQIGTRDGEPVPFVATVNLGLKAVEVLRQTDDKRALASALRVAAQPFVSGIDREALLEEAKAISIEAEDWSGVGWAIFAMNSTDIEVDGRPSEARAYFERGGDQMGLALLDLRIGARTRNHELIIGAAEALSNAGEDRHAEEAYVMAAIFGRENLSINDREALYQDAFFLAEKRGARDRQVIYLEKLINLAKEAGRSEDADKYCSLRSELQERVKQAAT